MATKDGERMIKTQSQLQMKIVQSKVPAIMDEELPIIWISDIDMDVAQDFIKKILQFESDPEVSEIYVYISSYGGEVFSGLAMIEAMNACSKPVNTVGVGICASAGADLLVCGTGTRWISENSFIHIHHTRNRLTDDLPGIDKAIKQMKQVEDKIFKMVISKSKMTLSDMKSKLKDEEKEWQISSQSAIKFGLVDTIGMPRFKKYVVVENDTTKKQD